MSRVKCSTCGKLAHVSIKGKAYCLDCAPKPSMPVMVEETLVNEVVIEKMERPKPWPEPPAVEDGFLPWDMELEKEEKKSWWERFLGYLSNSFYV